MEKRSWKNLAWGGLAAVVAAGAVSLCCAHRTPNGIASREGKPVPALSESVEKKEASDASDDPRVSYERLNDLVKSLKRRGLPASDLSSEEYTVLENFPAGDASREELTDMFFDDCVGRCFYMRNDDRTITKVKVNSEEGIRWYDEILGDTSDCYEFRGDNFWLYIDEEGDVKAWGIGKDSKMKPEEVYSPCK